MVKSENNMVELRIDGVRVAVPPGTMILEAAQKAGIRIPTLCNDKRLLPFGACRICVVQQKGRRGLIPACFNPVRSGMEILTNTPEVIRSRRIQLQLILTSHPLDCPVCDAGGQCRLQDLVYEYGIAENRYEGEKANEPVDHVSPFIERNVNRCILCGLCVRVDDEVVGANELSMMNRGAKTRIGTDFDRPLDCEFCGQCVSVCPVGALSDRLFLHKARPWDLQRTNTVCGYCGAGCALSIETRNRRVVRVRSDESLGANDGNLCVKGRFGWEYLHSPERLTEPLIRKGSSLVRTTWAEAIGYAAERFLSIREKGGELGGLGSARLTNEEAYLFQKLLRGCLHTNNLDHAGGYAYAGHLALRERLGYAASSSSFRDIRSADVILAVRSDLSETHPVVKYEVVQAVRRHRAKLIVVNSRSIPLKKFASIDLRVSPGTEAALIGEMIRAILDGGLADKEFLESRTSGLKDLAQSLMNASGESESATGVPAEDIREAARLFARAAKAVILISAGTGSESRDALLAEASATLALVTGRTGGRGGILILGEKNNSQGALDMGLSPALLPGYAEVADRFVRDRFAGIWGMTVPASRGMNAPAMLKAAREGGLKGLYLAGENPVRTYPDRENTLKALAGLDFLVVQDCFLTETAALAHLVLPAAAFAEKEGTFTSAERRVQRVRSAVPAPGEARSDLWIFGALSKALDLPLLESNEMEAARLSSPGAAGAVMEEIRTAVPLYAGIGYSRLEEERQAAGLQWPCPRPAHPGTSRLYESQFPGGKARLVPVGREVRTGTDGDYPWFLITGPVLFHSGSLSARSAGLNRIRPDCPVEIHPADAERIGCASGDPVSLESRFGTIEARAAVSDRTAPGVVFMPHHEGAVNRLRGWDPGPIKVKIRKANSEL